jgi:Protein of unknown function (Hypoth_ymh)
VSVINPDWARQKLNEFANAVKVWEFWENSTHVENDDQYWDALIKAIPTARKILEHLDSRLADSFQPEQSPGSGRSSALQGIAMLDDQAEVDQNLGDPAPTLSAGAFHSWVWGAAQTFWASEHYREGVNAAATAITAHTQQKVGRRDAVDRDLMNHVFLPDKAKVGQSYLRLPGDHTDKTIQSRQQALRPFADGCYAGLRNPAVHDHGTDWPEQEALEKLAALSVLARWIDECDVVVHGT